jgi:hypothetical protein
MLLQEMTAKAAVNKPFGNQCEVILFKPFYGSLLWIKFSNLFRGFTPK